MRKPIAPIAGEVAGSRLSDRFRPWLVIDVIGSDKEQGADPRVPLLRINPKATAS
jgi:hypothetical protein